MTTRWIGGGAALLAVGLSFSHPVPARAQGNPLNRPGGLTRRPGPTNFLPNLKEIAEQLAKRYNTRIVVDPAIFVTIKPTTPDASLTVEKAMDALATSAKQVAWRRVYPTQSQAGVAPTPDKLAAAVRALDLVQQTGLVLENPNTKQATSYLKNWPVAANFKEDLAQNQFSQEPIYVLYSTNPLADSRPPSEQLADMQRRSMEMMMNMDPDQMAEAANQGVQMFLSMDPDMRSRFMAVQMQAGMKMMQSMTPDQRQQMMQMGAAMAQQFIGGGQGPGKP